MPVAGRTRTHLLTQAFAWVTARKKAARERAVRTRAVMVVMAVMAVVVRVAKAVMVMTAVT